MKILYEKWPSQSNWIHFFMTFQHLSHALTLRMLSSLYINCLEEGCTHLPETEAFIQRCSYKKVFWNYAANLQENTHAEVWFQSSFIKITLWHGFTHVNLLHIFRTPFPKNNFGWLLLNEAEIDGVSTYEMKLKLGPVIVLDERRRYMTLSLWSRT